MNTLAIEGVSFSFGSTQVLDTVNLVCRKGELTGILGPNGCGKTTLIRVMAGYLVPSKGSIRYNGRSIQSIPPTALATLRAVVEQSIAAPFEFSVVEYVMLGRTPYLRRFERESERDFTLVDAALRLTGTESLQSRSIGELSGGELQRVMIARALAQEPSFLLLDEPTAHLDINHQLEVMEVLKELAKKIAVVAVIHDLNLALNYCDQVVVMEAGRIKQHGLPDEVLDPHSIRDTFCVDALQMESPAHDRAQLAFSPGNGTRSDTRLRVHLLGGGGSAQRFIFSLVQKGCQVSTGVLNEGDRDLEVARSMGCEVVAAPPFSRVSEEEKEQLRYLCRQADAIVVMSMPVGEGNIGNLEVAMEFLGHKRFLIHTPFRGYGHLDFTGGRGENLFKEIANRADAFHSPENLITLLRNKNETR